MKFGKSPIPFLRQNAMTAVNIHFNGLAAANHHEDIAALVAIARGNAMRHPIEDRHAQKAAAGAAIIGAQSSDEIDAVLKRFGIA